MSTRLATKKPLDEVAAWVPGAVAKRVIGFQTILAFCLLCTTFLLAIIVWRLATIPPRLITQLPNGQYASVQTNQIKLNMDDVVNFIQTILPRLYENSEGTAPGIEELRALNVINPNIVDGFLGDMQRNIVQMKQGHYVQSAIVQTVNHKTLAIRYAQKVVYAEATGIVILTDQEGHSQTSATQWAMLFYIKDIVDGSNNIINRYGLYLQNIVPQTPGTNNPTAPKPTGDENPGNSQNSQSIQTSPSTQATAAPTPEQTAQNGQPSQITGSEAPPLPTPSLPKPTPILTTPRNHR
jgi:hypothetical protein